VRRSLTAPAGSRLDVQIGNPAGTVPDIADRP